MNPLRSKRIAASVGLATALVVTLASPALATGRYSVAASIAGSGCTSQESRLKWWGSNEYQVTMRYQPRGDVWMCWTKYRLSDSDPKADYYSMVAVSYWRLTSGSGDFEAMSNQYIDSSVAAIDNVYGSTKSFTSQSDCTIPVDVAYGVGPFSAGTTLRLCKNHQVTRVSGTSRGAFWSMKKAGKLHTIETSLTQKVPQGVVPRYTVGFGTPQYTHTYNGNNYVPSAHLVYQEFTNK